VPTIAPISAPISSLPINSGPNIKPNPKKIMISKPKVQYRYGFCDRSKEKPPIKENSEFVFKLWRRETHEIEIGVGYSLFVSSKRLKLRGKIYNPTPVGDKYYGN
jgi:hypothetical protein